MDNRRVALFSSKHLLGESLERVLIDAGGMEILGPWKIDQHALGRLSGNLPDVVIIAGEEQQSAAASALTTQILERFSNLPVVHVMLESNTVRIYSSDTRPARSSDLIDAIRTLAV